MITNNTLVNNCVKIEYLTYAAMGDCKNSPQTFSNAVYFIHNVYANSQLIHVCCSKQQKPLL